MRHTGPWWSVAPAPSEPPYDSEQDELDVIEDDIWNTPQMLLDAVTDADPDLTIGAVVKMHAVKVRDELRKREEP